MRCPKCQSTHIRKNGFHKQGKQNHMCVACGRQFIKDYNRPKGDDEKTKQECLVAYGNGNG
jgi:transposase-like protein